MFARMLERLKLIVFPMYLEQLLQRHHLPCWIMEYRNRFNYIFFFHCKLHIAAANAYEEVLEFLLENEADVDVEDKDGWKPIHAAACWGNVRFITWIDSVMLVA